ncbi:hypothetical protein ECE50_013170 [Chitinophaga sp. Mgbs1]|uniref:Tetratricopeptide repeat protein n=1 Tax=Chitinophaga solisilvae TaxID=1233460 RepID=A0A9Q5DBT0_9BACT|nr:hypothetical protein [Chitinophaga solisilvae]
MFLQSSLQQVDMATMERLATEHPYFPAAHLLLAKKVYEHTPDLHHPLIKKAMLYTSHQHHFYQFVTHEPVLQEAANRMAPVIPEETIAVHDAIINEEALQEDITAETVSKVETAVADEIVMTATATEEATREITPEAITTVATPAIAPADIPQPADTEALSAEDLEMLARHNTSAFNGQETIAPEAADKEVNAVIPPPENETSAPIKIFPLKLEELEETETTLTFQPLYTDDYFAYKRLKEPGEADELNEQGMAEMKSFTSWLRQIKDNFAGRTSKDWYHQQLHRIYEEDEEPEISATVEKMAMNSITFNNDIVSETLAEIWVKQHQYQHAIRIYQKLSLLNPDKNAYFAQKIQELKSLIDKNKQ